MPSTIINIIHVSFVSLKENTDCGIINCVIQLNTLKTKEFFYFTYNGRISHDLNPG